MRVYRAMLRPLCAVRARRQRHEDRIEHMLTRAEKFLASPDCVVDRLRESIMVRDSSLAALSLQEDVRTVHHVNQVLSLCEVAGDWRRAERIFQALQRDGDARSEMARRASGSRE